MSAVSVERELRKLKRHKSTGVDTLPPGMLKDVASVIAPALANIINLSLRTGQVPNEWKIAQVLPLHKGGNKDDFNNYRPISILPVLSKILEKAAHQ